MNDTWELCELSIGNNLISCKYTYNYKYRSHGSIKRHKAKLVARGFTQKVGLDYEERFSLVVKLTTMKRVLTLAVKNA